MADSSVSVVSLLVCSLIKHVVAFLIPLIVPSYFLEFYLMCKLDLDIHTCYLCTDPRDWCAAIPEPQDNARTDGQPKERGGR